MSDELNNLDKYNDYCAKKTGVKPGNMSNGKKVFTFFLYLFAIVGLLMSGCWAVVLSGGGLF
jgi:hypothetical protein